MKEGMWFDDSCVGVYAAKGSLNLLSKTNHVLYIG